MSETQQNPTWNMSSVEHVEHRDTWGNLRRPEIVVENNAREQGRREERERIAKIIEKHRVGSFSAAAVSPHLVLGHLLDLIKAGA